MISGDVYRGDFENNERNGYGIMSDEDGRRYEGHWKNGLMNGKGTYNDGNNRVYIGFWKNGLKNGKFIEKNLATSEIEEGIYRDDRR